MPTRQLPPHPSLDHLRHQAKDLLRRHSLREPGSAQRLREFHPKLIRATDREIFSTHLTLAAAQFAIAREYGFASWARLKRQIENPSPSGDVTLPHHERIEDPVFRRAVTLIDSGDVPGLSLLLRENPGLIRRHVLFEGGNYFRNPGLLEFIAENPIRHGVLPPNIVDVAKTLLEAKPERSSVNETLGLVATGRVTRESKVQIRLIELLCAYGADPNSALFAAVFHGEFEAVHKLIRSGAKPDLATLAALGETTEFLQHLPSSDSAQRHQALAAAAQYGHLAIVQALLDAGEDPDRYNPPGAHSHSTPLHQAALAGHLGIAKLLVERGARLDRKDLLWQGTPADWARHAGKTAMEAWLREQWEIRPRSRKGSA